MSRPPVRRFDRPVLAFLADDTLMPWAATLLASVSATDPDLTMLLLPRSDEIGRLRALSAIHRLEVLNADFAEIERLGDILGGGPELATLRALAMFDVAAPVVAFIECRSVLLQAVSPLLTALTQAPSGLVYAPEPTRPLLPADIVVPGQPQGRPFGTYFLAFTGAMIESRRLTQAVRENLVDYLFTRGDAGPLTSLLNFAVPLLGVPVRRLGEVSAALSMHVDARDPAIREAGDILRDEEGRLLPLLHWPEALDEARTPPFANILEGFRRTVAPPAPAMALRRDAVASVPAAPESLPTIGLFCKSFAEDFDRLAQMLDSLARHNLEGLPLALSLPSQDIPLFRERFPDVTHPVFADQTLTGSEQEPGNGWIYQQVVKLCSDRTGVARNLFVVDSDTYFVRPFGRADFTAADGTPLTCLSTHSHNVSPGSLSQILSLLDGAPDPVFSAEELADLRAGRAPDLQQDPALLRSLCHGTDLADVFGRPRRVYHCQPGPILHGSVLRRLRAQPTGQLARTEDHVPRVLLGLSPWEYNWHMEYLLASDEPLRVRSLPVLHIPSDDQLQALRARGVTEARVARRYLAIAMAARHFDALRLNPVSASAGAV